jgi:hypothetical protein
MTQGTFDPRYSHKILSIAATASVIVVAVTALGLLTAETECPGWNSVERGGHTTFAMLSGMTVITGVAALVLMSITTPKEKFYRNLIDSLDRAATKDASAGVWTQDSLDRLMLAVGIGWVVFCLAPLILMIAKC